MGADIYLTLDNRNPWRDGSDAAYRDSYSRYEMLPYLGLSYWGDLLPRLDATGRLPLADHAWLAGQLRERIAARMDAPDALEQARAHIAKEIDNPTAELVAECLDTWRYKAARLLDMTQRAEAAGSPLWMSL